MQHSIIKCCISANQQARKAELKQGGYQYAASDR